MKKIIALFLVLVMMMPCAVLAADKVTVEINGNEVYFEDQQPAIVDGRTLVPFRAIAEALGCLVEWEDAEKAVYIAFARKEHVQIIRMPIGSTEISVIEYKKSEEGTANEEIILTTDVPASVINSRTMVPLRVIGDVFGGKVNWNDETKTASVDIDIADHIFATDEVCRQFMNESFMKAKHILVLAGEERSDKEAKTLADEINKKVAKGEDFDKLMAEYSEDPGSLAYPEGYLFTYGEMVAEFENAVTALEIGGISKEPVKSSFGYHIIKREAISEEEYAAFIDEMKFYILISLSGLEMN